MGIVIREVGRRRRGGREEIVVVLLGWVGLMCFGRSAGLDHCLACDTVCRDDAKV